MEYSRLWAFDGNNSLKRMAPLAGRQVADTRKLDDSEYFLSRDYINEFANDVLLQKPLPVHDPQDEDLDYEESDPNPTSGGDPTDGNPPGDVSNCVKNWKAAASDEKKKMWAIFDETGIFAAACCHSLILWIADMVRSGELYVPFMSHSLTMQLILQVSVQNTLSPYFQKSSNWNLERWAALT